MKKILIFLFAALFAIFLLNSFHEEYPDEYDSIVGGRYITEGKLPYRDWFQHHQPGAYVLAAALLPFSGQSFVKFRVLLGVTFFLINVGSYLLIRKRLQGVNLNFYILLLFAIAFGGTYFWGEMLLADILAAYLLLPAYALLLLKTWHGQRFEFKDLLLVSIFTFLVFFTSSTFIYVVIGLNLYAIYCYLMGVELNRNNLLKQLKSIALALLTPYVLFFLYLLATGSLKDYYFSNVIYNQYYIYNYPHVPGTPINPIRYAIVIGNAFVNNYFPALAGIIHFPLGDPLQVTLAFSNLALFAVLLLNKNYAFLFPFCITLIYANARSNPQQIKETDYQAAVYILTSMFAGAFSLTALREMIDKGKTIVSTRIIGGFLLILLGIYWFFSFFYLALKLEQRFYPKYMGDAPYIYDRPQIANYVNKIVTPNDYVWIGPFEFKELFYLNTKQLPSKYHWFLQHAASTKIKDELIADLEKRRPKVIVFRRGYAPWGGNAAGYNYFFTDFLDKNYFRIFKLNEEMGTDRYKWKIGNTINFDIDGDFNFDKTRKDEILAELIRAELIEEIQKK